MTVSSATAVTLTPGPESDSGSVSETGGTAVSYDEIEALNVMLTGAAAATGVTINGTNADDDITVVGTGADDYTVSVNAGPAVQFTGSTVLDVTVWRAMMMLTSTSMV